MLRMGNLSMREHDMYCSFRPVGCDRVPSAENVSPAEKTIEMTYAHKHARSLYFVDLKAKHEKADPDNHCQLTLILRIAH